MATKLSNGYRVAVVTITLALVGNGLLVWRDQAVQQEQLKRIEISIADLRQEVKALRLVLVGRTFGRGV